MEKKEVLGEEKLKLINFTKQEFEYFCENCMFSELQENILKDRIKDKSIIEIAMKYNISDSKVNKEIRKIKNKILKVI
jgi:predicted DNA-binding protein YlxM (UPF0122 family)